MTRSQADGFASDTMPPSAPRRSVASNLARWCWRRRALWLAPVLLALLAARALRKAGAPLSSPAIYALH